MYVCLLHSVANQIIVDRISWFQMAVDPEITKERPLSRTEIAELVEEYIARNEDEISKMIKEQRSGRPENPTLAMLNSIKKEELSHYIKGPGLQIPDLSSNTALEALAQWKGTRESLDLVPLVRVLKSTLSSEMTDR